MVLYAKDIVEPDFISLSGDTNALVAAKMMRDRRHGFVIIMSEGKAVGIVTEWDYISKIVAAEKNPESVLLNDIMSTNVVTVNGKDGIDYVSKLMAEKGIRRVLVLKKGKLSAS